MNLIKIESSQFSAARVKSNQIEIEIKSKIDSNHIKSNQIKSGGPWTAPVPEGGISKRQTKRIQEISN